MKMMTPEVEDALRHCANDLGNALQVVKAIMPLLSRVDMPTQEARAHAQSLEGLIQGAQRRLAAAVPLNLDSAGKVFTVPNPSQDQSNGAQ